MFCQRCRGLMIKDRFMDYFDESGQMFFSAWRCVACGEIVDPVILANRVNMPVVRRKRPRQRVTLCGSRKPLTHSFPKVHNDC